MIKMFLSVLMIVALTTLGLAEDRIEKNQAIVAEFQVLTPDGKKAKIEELRIDLESNDSNKKKSALYTLFVIGDTQTIDSTIDGLGDLDSFASQARLRKLSESGSLKAIPILVKGLKTDEKPKITHREDVVITNPSWAKLHAVSSVLRNSAEVPDTVRKWAMSFNHVPSQDVVQVTGIILDWYAANANTFQSDKWSELKPGKEIVLKKP